jgi:hypothetical protein
MQAAVPHAALYSRAHIPLDQKEPPYALTGVRRVLFALFYFGIIGVTFSGVAYCLYVNPLFSIFAFFIAYVGDNIGFSITHVRYHASFIELPESKMEVFLHNSFIHHYRDVQIYHKTWLESRVSYFMDPKEGVFSSVFLTVVVWNLLLGWLMYHLHPVLGISYFSMLWLAELLQSTIHEWYHNPVSNRKLFYSAPVYWLFTFLEKIGIASTRDHLQHHRHRLHNLNEVEKWLDLYLPMGEVLPALIWKKAIARYVPGKENMTTYVNKVTRRVYAVLFLSATLCYLAGYYLWLR